MSTQRKLLFLAGLVVIWAIVVVLQVNEEPEEDAYSVVANHPLVAQGNKPSHPDNTLTLTDTFDNPRRNVRFSTPRNIFNPLGFTNSMAPSSAKQSSSNSKKTTPSPPKPVVTQKAPAPPPGPSPGELAAQRARQQLSQYRFLGYLTKGGQSQAFLSNGQAIYIVKQGEQVEGRIRVRKIDPTIVVLSVTVQETGTDVEAEIPLTKEQQG